MGVRVRIRIEFRDRSLMTIALVNTGFEGDVPEVLVPPHIASELGVWPRLPDRTIVETYKSASGLMRVYRIKGAMVSLISKEKIYEPIETYLVVSEYTDIVLINDQLISKMNIIIEDPAKGLWRIRGEKKIRKSER